MAVSARSTQCCVCSLFHNPSTFLSFEPQLVSDTYKKLSRKLHNNDTGSSADRKNKQFPTPVTELELRVVVQRVLINLPTTSKETMNESSLSDLESDSDEMITCNSCGICVHKCKFYPSC